MIGVAVVARLEETATEGMSRFLSGLRWQAALCLVLGLALALTIGALAWRNDYVRAILMCRPDATHSSMGPGEP